MAGVMGLEDPVDPLVVTLDDFVDFDKEKPPLLYPGVYVFQDVSGKKPVNVYIGQSKNVPQRVKQHKKKPWYNEDLEIKMLYCADFESQLMAETAMILRYRPINNKAIKIGLAKKTGAIYSLNFIRGRRG